MKELISSLGMAPEVEEALLQRHQAVVDAYEQRLRAQAVEGAVKQAVAAAGGRNLTAIRALLDESAFGENPEEAAREAVAKVKGENPYLFGGFFTAPGTGSAMPKAPTHQELEKMSLAEYRAYRKGN